jgi:AcrR family transcriptional regulator
MARPRKFDEQVAVDRAMQEFWSSGYTATSTERLCEVTGLGRSSIYNTFQDKHELFREALGRYRELTSASRGEILDGEGSIRDRLELLLNTVVEEDLAHDRRGCLAVNTNVELGRTDAAIAVELRRDTERFVGDLAMLFEHGQRTGEIDRTKDPRALAQFVHATVGGLRLAARSGCERAVLDNILAVALTAIWPSVS